MSKAFQKSVLALSLLPLMYGELGHASDIEIYQVSKKGQTTLMMMLDTSGSMDSRSIQDDYGSNQAKYCTYTESTGGTYSYDKQYCSSDKKGSGTKYYDRISRLKDAMFKILNSADGKLDNIYLGIGNFSANGDSRSGQILVPAKPLGPAGSANRNALKEVIAKLVEKNGTPSAHAYAEAAAYMLGTTTENSTTKNVNYRKDIYQDSSSFFTAKYKTCNQYNDIDYSSLTQTCSSWSASINGSVPQGYDGSNSGTYYVLVGTTVIDYNLDSGFSSSASTTKNGNKYISPLPTTDKECSGQGIYFLTDGKPDVGNIENNSHESRSITLMRKALTTSYSFNSSQCSSLPTDQNDNWSCIGEFARNLNDSTKNPSGVSIKTAVVGFGAVFSAEGLATTVKDSSTGKSRKYYNCASDKLSSDAKNACNWGEKSGGLPSVGGFGEGGFYSASSTDDVVESLRSFIGDLNPDFPVLSTGSVTIPQDSFDPSNLQPFGYVTLLEPQPASSNRVWVGNVKKYNISNGTTKSPNGNSVFKDRNGFLADNTYDLWSTHGTTTDGGTIQVGGVYERLPVPTTILTAGRNVFVDLSTTSGSNLTKIEPNIATLGNITSLTTTQKLSLLNYLGYDVPIPTTALTDLLFGQLTLPAVPTSPYRSLGAVLHSTPVLATYSGILGADGNLVDSSRNDYIIFGTMEGALHVVDASSYLSDKTNGGVEKFAFIPKEVLDKQATALKPGTTGSLSYGVDGPWTVYTEYSTQAASGANTAKIKAKVIQAYGGLRMGGSAYYGLDLTNINTPKLLFKISPTINAVTNAQTGTFARMGQSWSKPTVARVRYNGKVRRVVIVGGGYDPQYEVPSFNKDGSATTLGNAVYMVDAENGDLIWSATTTNNQNLKYSIPGRVNVLDRDADGLIDHLYFADLGGQVFRADLDNRSQYNADNKAAFSKRVIRLANLADSSNVRPRFYEAPAVTIHDDGTQRFAVVSIGSGDRSSPLDITQTQNGVFGIIDRDVARADVLTAADSTLYTQNLLRGSFKFNPSTADVTLMSNDMSDNKQDVSGWYYSLGSTVTSGYKAFYEPVAINGDLYQSVFDPTAGGTTTGACSSSVRGSSTVYRYCLPYGVCTDLTNGNKFTKFSLGAGLQGISIGPDSSSSLDTRRLIFNQPNVVKDDNGDSNNLRLFNTPRQLIPTRWYEKLPK